MENTILNLVQYKSENKIKSELRSHDGIGAFLDPDLIFLFKKGKVRLELSQHGLLFESKEEVLIYLKQALQAWSLQGNVNLKLAKNFLAQLGFDLEIYIEIHKEFQLQFELRMQSLLNKKTVRQTLHDLKSTSLYFGAVGLSKKADQAMELSLDEGQVHQLQCELADQYKNWKTVFQFFLDFEKFIREN